jgi:putative transposase
VIESLRTEYPLSLLCRVFAVSAQGYYAWRTRSPSAHAQADAALSAQVCTLFAHHHRRYGSPRIHQALRKTGVRCSRKRIERLMRQAGLRARAQRARRVQTSTSDPGRPPAPNLLAQEFSVDAPDQKWVSDFTYVPTQEGWLYLAVILDLFARKVVGWQMSASMSADLSVGALEMALAQRTPQPGCLLHSDQGRQYVDHAYQSLLSKGSLVCSMSRRANCYDNAVAESFFSTLKAEVVELFDFASRAQARGEILLYIEGYYNPVRLHSTLGYCSPDEFDAAYRSNQVSAGRPHAVA